MPTVANSGTLAIHRRWPNRPAAKRAGCLGVVLDEIEYLEPMPTLSRSGNRVPLTDHRRIMERAQIRTWVEEQGVSEVVENHMHQIEAVLPGRVGSETQPTLVAAVPR